MGRRKAYNVQVKIPISEHVLAQIDSHFRSPITGEIVYGARGTLISALLSLWMKSGYSISTLSHALDNHLAQHREMVPLSEEGQVALLDQLLDDLLKPQLPQGE